MISGQANGYRTMQGIVVDRLRDAILDGEYPPGAWLRLRSISVQLGTSTMPVREALQILAAEGLVQTYPHRGARVTPLSAEEFEEVYMARLGIEGLAARLGALAMFPEGLAQMRAELGAMEDARQRRDWDAWLAHDDAFHQTHYRAAQRPALLDRINTLTRQGSRYTRRARLEHVATGHATSFHRDLMQAIEAKDGRTAELLVREDLDFTVRNLGNQLFGHRDGVFTGAADHDPPGSGGAP